MQNDIHSLVQMLFVKYYGIRASIYNPVHEYEPIVKETQHCWAGFVLIYFE